MREMAGFSLRAEVHSENNFPAGAGIASSASAFAALALAASAAAGLELSERDLSRLARRGSGSACRSIPGGFVEWQAGTGDEDSFAFSIAPPEHWPLADCIAIVDHEHKATGSTEGHALAATSPLQANCVAKWNGSAWSALQSGANDIVRALVYDSSENMYVGGGFTSAGGASANRITRWATPLPAIVPTTGSSLFCNGENTTVSIGLTDVIALFGYQFIVNYDPSLVSAAGAFVNPFFDTSADASLPSGWNATCSGGECKFAASKVEPVLLECT